jgi:hypothetical protein
MSKEQAFRREDMGLISEEFNSFKKFKSFQPPPVSSPATRGRMKEGV